MYAIIEAGGRQYRVTAGDEIEVDLMPAEAGEEVAFDRVLTVVKEGGEVAVGTPTVDGARAVARVLNHGRGRKILVFKYKPKVNYRKRQGHRQDFTRIRIESIEA